MRGCGFLFAICVQFMPFMPFVCPCPGFAQTKAWLAGDEVSTSRGFKVSCRSFPVCWSSCLSPVVSQCGQESDSRPSSSSNSATANVLASVLLG